MCIFRVNAIKRRKRSKYIIDSESTKVFLRVARSTGFFFFIAKWDVENGHAHIYVSLH